MTPIHLMTLEPAHFHAATFQKEMLPGISRRVHVFAQDGPDLAAHLKRIEQFNSRKQNPTCWEELVHASNTPLADLLASCPGNVVIVSGKNRGKIQRLHSLVGNGLHLLADKPWIIEAADFAQLTATLDEAGRNGVVAYDAMTQRFEISCLLVRELVNDPAIFGELQDGSLEQPAIAMESVHYYLKEVGGAPLRRPAWIFDIHQQGEGLSDVGTHIVDLVQWTAFPNQAIEYRTDVEVLRASRWPTVISLDHFRRITGEHQFPVALHSAIVDGSLHCFANNSVTYRLRGVHVRVEVTWSVEPADGSKDSEQAVFRGTKARIEVRQRAAERFIPEVYVAPNSEDLKDSVGAALAQKVTALQGTHPGLGVRLQGNEYRLIIPDALRISHEAHFALLASRFLGYVRKPDTLPAWEKPNMLAKYYVTTEGVRRARVAAENSGTQLQRE